MDKELAIKIKALVQGAKDVAALAGEVQKLGNEGRKPIPDTTENLRNGAKQTRGVIADLGRELVGLVTAGAIVKFAKDSVQAFAQAESAFRGLEAVANASGFGVANALKEAEKLAADGLISVAESAKALQNLLARGYSLDQAVATLERLKDSAAFNRAAHLQLGEAVVTASEGLKNENSILVDNAGVTKNVAKMWEEYAAKLGVTTESLSQQQKIEAEFQGIMAETQAQLGNAQKALEGLQGQLAKSEQESNKFSVALGELLAPAVSGLTEIGVYLINNVFKPFVLLFQAMAVGSGVLASALGHVFDAVKTGEFSGVSDAIKADMQTAKEVLQDSYKQLYESELDIKKSLKGGEDAQKIADNALKRAGANGDEQKKLTKDRIKDYEKLRDAIKKAWDDSIEAERNYLAEAKKLRAEANAFNSQSLAGASPQEVATKEISLRADLRIAQERLQRLVNEGGSLDDIRAQAEAVQQLADQYRSLTDVVEEDADKADISQRSDEAVKQSKLNLAKALEQAAAEEHQRQQDQLKILADVEKSITEISQSTLKINTDDSALDATLAKLRQAQQAIDPANANNFTGVYDSNGNAVYRDPPKFADGGILPGSSPHDRADNILYWGTAGEGLVNRPAMRHYGAAWLDAMNKLKLPKFASGGVLGRMSVPSVPSGSSFGSGRNLQPMNLTIPGMGTYRMQAASDVASTLQRDLSLEALKYGRRR